MKQTYLINLKIILIKLLFLTCLKVDSVPQRLLEPENLLRPKILNTNLESESSQKSFSISPPTFHHSHYHGAIKEYNFTLYKFLFPRVEFLVPLGPDIAFSPVLP